jgi:hypothetical protein
MACKTSEQKISFFFGFVLAYIFAYYKLYDVDYLTQLDCKLEIYLKDGKRTIREEFDRWSCAKYFIVTTMTRAHDSAQMLGT